MRFRRRAGRRHPHGRAAAAECRGQWCDDVGRRWIGHHRSAAGVDANLLAGERPPRSRRAGSLVRLSLLLALDARRVGGGRPGDRAGHAAVLRWSARLRDGREPHARTRPVPRCDRNGDRRSAVGGVGLRHGRPSAQRHAQALPPAALHRPALHRDLEPRNPFAVRDVRHEGRRGERGRRCPRRGRKRRQRRLAAAGRARPPHAAQCAAVAARNQGSGSPVMIRTALRHHAPTEVAEAVALLDAHAERAAVLGGGTMLVPSLTRGERDVDHVIDLRRLGVDATTVTADGVHVGAMVTYAHLLAASPFPGPAQLLQRVAGGITGGPQIRCQGTICGSAAYANPSSEVPAVLVALDATMHLHGPGGARITPASAFFLDAFTVDLRRGELLTGVSVAARAARLGYYKLKLAEGSWPIATAAAVLPPTGVGYRGAVVTLGAVSARPIQLDLAPVLDDAGRLPSDDAVDDWVAAQIGEPWDDELAPS